MDPLTYKQCFDSEHKKLVHNIRELKSRNNELIKAIKSSESRANDLSAELNELRNKIKTKTSQCVCQNCNISLVDEKFSYLKDSPVNDKKKKKIIDQILLLAQGSKNEDFFTRFKALCSKISGDDNNAEELGIISTSISSPRTLNANKPKSDHNEHESSYGKKNLNSKFDGQSTSKEKTGIFKNEDSAPNNDNPDKTGGRCHDLDEAKTKMEIDFELHNHADTTDQPRRRSLRIARKSLRDSTQFDYPTETQQAQIDGTDQLKKGDTSKKEAASDPIMKTALREIGCNIDSTFTEVGSNIRRKSKRISMKRRISSSGDENAGINYGNQSITKQAKVSSKVPAFPQIRSDAKHSKNRRETILQKRKSAAASLTHPPIPSDITSALNSKLCEAQICCTEADNPPASNPCRGKPPKRTHHDKSGVFEPLSSVPSSFTSANVSKFATEYFQDCAVSGCTSHIVFSCAFALSKRYIATLKNAVLPMLRELVKLEALSLQHNSAECDEKNLQAVRRVRFCPFDLSAVISPNDLHPTSIQFATSAIDQLLTVRNEGKKYLERRSKLPNGMKVYMSAIRTISLIDQVTPSRKLNEDTCKSIRNVIEDCGGGFGMLHSLIQVSRCASMLFDELTGICMVDRGRVGLVSHPDSVLHKRLLQLLSTSIRFNLRRLVDTPPLRPTVASSLEAYKSMFSERTPREKTRSNLWKSVVLITDAVQPDERALSTVISCAVKSIYWQPLSVARRSIEDAEAYALLQNQKVRGRSTDAGDVSDCAARFEKICSACSLFRAASFLLSFYSWNGLDDTIREFGGWERIERHAEIFDEAIAGAAPFDGDAHLSLLKDTEGLKQTVHQIHESGWKERAETAVEALEELLMTFVNRKRPQDSWIEGFLRDTKGEMQFPTIAAS